MANSTADQAETERQIRARLEETGEFGKMRAMIVDAALHSLARDQPAEVKQQLFFPTQALQEAKGSDEGRRTLGAVHAYLTQLGLSYTASVLALEAGISAEELASSGSGGGSASAITGLLSSDAVRTAAPMPVPVPAPVPAVVEGAKALATTAATSSSSVSSAKPDSAGEPSSDEAEEPQQPGAEDSTYYISKWKKKTFVRVNQVVGQQVQVEYLTDCSVMVLDPLDSMTVDDCEGGELVVAACEGSVFLRNCKNMVVHVACKQLRTRDCENVDLHIFTTTDPVVEMSHHMTFRPFHLRLPNLRAHFKAARLDPACNRFVHVYDFTVDEPSLPQPHFTVAHPDPSVAMEDRAGTYGTPECPPQIEDLLVGKLLPAASSESGQNKSYNIKLGSAAWVGAATGKEAAANGSGSTEERVEKDGAGDSDEEEDEVDSVASETRPGAAAIPVPSAGTRPPVAPAALPTTLGAPKLGGLDDQEYSSFDESSESVDEDDKYEVEEDDDDF